MNAFTRLALPRPVRVLNVCGGHERSISKAGLRSVLPDGIALIPGPGCPVCICPEEDILAAIQLAATAGVILAAFGDMLRVPANVARGELRSLAEARAKRGGCARHRVPARRRPRSHTPTRSDRWCSSSPGSRPRPRRWRPCWRKGLPDNLSLLLSARRTWRPSRCCWTPNKPVRGTDRAGSRRDRHGGGRVALRGGPA
ncbi:MAG: hypothetical protein WDN49_04840 [Acetobacteraceae bacterium]